MERLELEGEEVSLCIGMYSSLRNRAKWTGEGLGFGFLLGAMILIDHFIWESHQQLLCGITGQMYTHFMMRAINKCELFHFIDNYSA